MLLLLEEELLQPLQPVSVVLVPAVLALPSSPLRE